MDPIVDEAVCLRQWDYSETSQTAVLFTRTLGMVRVLGKGTRRNDPRFSGGLEVGTLGEAVMYPKESGLATLAGWDLLSTYRNARASLESYHAMMFAIDMPRHVLSEDDPHRGAFEGLVQALARLGDEDWRPVMASWLWLLLGEAGFQPMIDIDQRPFLFSPSEGRLMSGLRRTESHVWSVHETTAMGLRSLSQGVPPESVVAERVGRLLAWYICEIAGREPPTLQPLFGSQEPSFGGH